MRLDGIADPEVAMDVMTTIIEFNGDLTEMLAAGKGARSTRHPTWSPSGPTPRSTERRSTPSR